MTKTQSESRMIKEFERNGKTVEVKVSYSLGGLNYFTYEQEKRGYYVYVQPMIKGRTAENIVMRETSAFSGVKKLLLEVNRKSGKQLNAACEMVNDELIEQLLTQCKFN